MRKITFLLITTIILMFTGCSQKTQELSLCDKYINNICVVNKIEKVTICKDPLILDNITYCR